MVKMVSLKKSAADRRAEKDALGEPGLASVPAEDEGVRVNLDHHHLMKMGVGGGMKSGHKVEFHGRGVVERSETRSDPDGDGDRHSATIRLHRGGLEHEIPSGGDEERRSVRGDLEKAYAGVKDKELPDKKSSGPAK